MVRTLKKAGLALTGYVTAHCALLVKCALLVVLVSALVGLGARVTPSIDRIEVGSSLRDDNTVTVSVEISGSPLAGGNFWCYIGDAEDLSEISESEWVKADAGQCEIPVSAGNWRIYARDPYGNVSSDDSLTVNAVVSISIDSDICYLALKATRQLHVSLITFGGIDRTVTWTSSNPDAVQVDGNGLVTAVSNGTATITATAYGGAKAVCEVVATDLIIRMQDSDQSSKQTIPSRYYTLEQAELLDKILFSRVDEAGYGTRAGVVAAARFLTMEFPFRIPYFYENGRLNNFGMKSYADGEGRYYHRGLYIHESKYATLDPKGIIAGPAMWGEPLMNFTEQGYFHIYSYYPNGLDCSGFVTWACLNGGWDVKDSGAGDYVNRDDDMCDYGIRTPITLELMKSGKVKVGDLIGADGHIAIIAGMDDTYIYIAESLGRGVGITKVRIENNLIWSATYDYIMLMDTYYGGAQGVYEEMWETGA